jgi:hypothetical protein
VQSPHAAHILTFPLIMLWTTLFIASFVHRLMCSSPCMFWPSEIGEDISYPSLSFQTDDRSSHSSVTKMSSSHWP